MLPVALAEEAGNGQVGTLLRILPGRNQGVSLGCNSHQKLRSSSKFLVFGRIHFCVAVMATVTIFLLVVGQRQLSTPTPRGLYLLAMATFAFSRPAEASL